MQIYAYDTKSEYVKDVSYQTILFELDSEKWVEDRQDFGSMINVLIHSLENNNKNAMCCCVFDETDKSLIAICYCYFPQFFEKTCILNELIVRHDCRKKFWGSFLVSKVKMHAVIDKKVETFLLTPLKSAIDFWEKMCFSPVKNVQNLFPISKVVPYFSLECLNAMYYHRI